MHTAYLHTSSRIGSGAREASWHKFQPADTFYVRNSTNSPAACSLVSDVDARKDWSLDSLRLWESLGLGPVRCDEL